MKRIIIFLIKELFAYGIGNIIAGVFEGFPGCVGLSRCVILDGVGGKTQVYGIFSSILILVVILFLGPLFKTLPNVKKKKFKQLNLFIYSKNQNDKKACLAAIIVVALKSLILEVRIFPKLLKKSKIEAVSYLKSYWLEFLL